MKVEGRSLRPLWLLFGDGETEVMTLADGSGGEALPVFGFEEEAEMFRLLGAEGRWRSRQVKVEDVAALLRGPYSGVGKVALDPVPTGVDGTGPLDVAWPGREEFLDTFSAG